MAFFDSNSCRKKQPNRFIKVNPKYRPYCVWNGSAPATDNNGNATAITGIYRGDSYDLSEALNRRISIANIASPGSDFLAFIVFKNVDSSSSWKVLLAGKTYWPNGNGFLVAFNASTNTIQLNGGDGGTFPTVTIPGIGAVDGEVKVLVVKFSGTSAQAYHKGQSYGSVTIAAAGTWPAGLGIGNYAGTSNVADSQCGIIYAGGVLGAGDPVSLSKNIWQIFKKKQEIVFFSQAAGGAIDLSGNAQSAATNTGSVNVSLGIVASSISIATDAGTLSISENLSGTSASISTDTGTPTVQVSISGAALSEAISNALVNISVSAGGGANASALDVGQVSLSVQLSGADIAQASANGLLTSFDNVQLSGIANSTASLQGAVSIGVPLSGAEVSRNTITGDLTVSGVVQLTAALLNGALTTGNLELSIPLAVSLSNQSTASGTLTVIAPYPPFETDRSRTLTFLL